MANENTESGLASSMTDLMTSLAVIFILLLVASLNNSQQEGETTRNLILAKLKQKMEIELADYKDQGFEVKNDPKDPLALIVVVPEGLLNFQLNKSDVPEKGIEFLNTILPKMASTICSDEFRKDSDHRARLPQSLRSEHRGCHRRRSRMSDRKPARDRPLHRRQHLGDTDD
jgi:hypothetical protein